MEFEPDLMEYLSSIYINCSLCAQNCIRSLTVDERAGPALKNPSVWWRYVLWEGMLWSHGKLWFCISGWEGKEQNVTEHSRWCEQRGMQTAHEIRECLFSKHILHLEFLGSCLWRLMCSFWRWFWLEKRQWQAEGGPCVAGWILPTWGGELEALEARDWSCWEPRTAAEERAGVWKRVL